MKRLWILMVIMGLVFGVTGCKEGQAPKTLEEVGSIEEETGEEENWQGMWEEETDQETETEGSVK